MKIVTIGALVAFGGYAAIAGSSALLGRAPDEAVPLAIARPESKPDLDCASSRFAWRPECRTAKGEGSAEEARRTRRRAVASAGEPDAPAAASEPVTVASVEPVLAAAVAEPVAEAAPPPARPIERRPPPKRPEPPVVEAPPSPPARVAAKEPTRPVASAPSRSRAESLRFKAEPKPADANESGSIRTGASRAEESDERRARSRRVVARRDAAQFASLRTERVRRARPAEAWEPMEAGPAEVDDGWRSRREARLPRRERPGRQAVPPGLTVTSVRTYELPDGRLVSVHVRPRPEVVRALIAQHRANMARTAYAYPW